MVIEFLLWTPGVAGSWLHIALNWRGKVTLVQAHQVRHDSRLVAQHGLHFALWLVLQVGLVFVLFSGPKC